MTITAADPELVASVKTHEGWRAHPYLCSAGKITIGYGHNCDANPPDPAIFRRWERTGLAPEEGEMLLRVDLAEALEAARRYPWFAEIDAAAQRVVAEMIFQLGAAGFARFRRLREALERRDYADAAAEMRSSKWHRQDTPARAETLARRMGALA